MYARICTQRLTLSASSGRQHYLIYISLHRYIHAYIDKTIDIDILYAENLIIDQENLQLPHPFIQDRKFTTVPLSEISPDFIHPIFEKNQAQLNQECQDNLPVYLYQL